MPVGNVLNPNAKSFIPSQANFVSKVFNPENYQSNSSVDSSMLNDPPSILNLSTPTLQNVMLTTLDSGQTLEINSPNFADISVSSTSPSLRNLHSGSLMCASSLNIEFPIPVVPDIDVGPLRETALNVTSASNNYDVSLPFFHINENNHIFCTSGHSQVGKKKMEIIFLILKILMHY